MPTLRQYYGPNRHGLPPITDDERALLRACVEDYESDVPRLVYADWLQEHYSDPALLTYVEFLRESLSDWYTAKSHVQRSLLLRHHSLGNRLALRMIGMWASVNPRQDPAGWCNPSRWLRGFPGDITVPSVTAARRLLATGLLRSIPVDGVHVQGRKPGIFNGTSISGSVCWLRSTCRNRWKVLKHWELPEGVFDRLILGEERVLHRARVYSQDGPRAQAIIDADRAWARFARSGHYYPLDDSGEAWGCYLDGDSGKAIQRSLFGASV